MMKPHIRNEKQKLLNQKMQILKDSKCIDIGRTCNLVWLHFKALNLDFCLDIQSAFRFSKDNEILITNSDIYEPKKTYHENLDFDYEKFNWDIQGENRFDEWMDSRKSELINSTVTDVSVSVHGDLYILFDNEVSLEIFNNSLDECWRFFERHKKNHTVVKGATCMDE